jgi:hypothetical protein
MLHYDILVNEYAFIKDNDNAIAYLKKIIGIDSKNFNYRFMLFLVCIDVNLLSYFIKLKIKMRRMIK